MHTVLLENEASRAVYFNSIFLEMKGPCPNLASNLSRPGLADLKNNYIAFILQISCKVIDCV